MVAVLLQWTCNCILLWKLCQKYKLTILQILSGNFVDTRKSLFFTIITLCIRFGLTCDTSQASNLYNRVFIMPCLWKELSNNTQNNILSKLFLLILFFNKILTYFWVLSLVLSRKLFVVIFVVVVVAVK